MPFVLDASTTLLWCFPDEGTDRAQIALDRLGSTTALVPSIWALEIGNALQMGVRRGRLRDSQLERVADLIRRLDIQIEATTLTDVMERLIPLALRHQLSVYDSSYLDLALRRNLPLASSDRHLIEVASAVGVAIL